MVNEREISPELLANVAVTLFEHISIRAVLEEHIRFHRLTAQDLGKILFEDKEYYQTYSLETCESLARVVINYIGRATAWYSGWGEYSCPEMNILDLLLLISKELLVMNQNRIESRYEQIEAWRMIVRYLGEELALSACYAQWDHEHSKPIRSRYDEFDWPYVTGHNNKQLNSMLQRGVSDHHNHLRGSTPYFHVSWVNLMNQPDDQEFHRKLRSLSQPKWSADKLVPSRKREDTVVAMEHKWELAQARAAWIRFYLCERLTGKTDATKKYYDLENMRGYDNWRMLLASRGRLQSELDSYMYLANTKADYALAFAKLGKPNFSRDYHLLIGERWLYYRIFRDYCKAPEQRELDTADYNLFCVYFLLRLRLRRKMVQSNDYIGFDNFQRIERRKAYFIEDDESERILTRLAINETLKKPYITELEVRITPDTSQICRFETAINKEGYSSSVDRFLAERNSCSRKTEKNNIRDRYYYVVHFLKQRDPRLEMEDYLAKGRETERFVCRHHDARQRLLEQARELIHFREERPLLARRILGIDAASQEIGCRPEVFGTVYRLLGEHQAYYGGYLEERRKLPALGKTYHVGEDFRDIVNGLRAIDEVINFLEFDSGDRLGHATVLGVNVDDWYEHQRHQISLSVQDRLDDLAWLYHALIHFSIDGTEALKERLKQEFDYRFRIVYRSSLKPEKVERLMRLARRDCYDRTEEDHNLYHEHICNFEILDYYRAWTIRGDDPECYIDGYFRKPNGGRKMIPEEEAKICKRFPSEFNDRYIPEYSLLNYMYQFDEGVRERGRQTIKVDVTGEYIRAAKAIQREMRYLIARRGISIETNPTSNVLIGTFRKYEKHPILSFYNRGLPVSEEEERNCAQLHVSINTDDRGVFYTDLETEYALLAKSVEGIMDENDVQRFKNTDIYAWLDQIRMMGNDQSFRHWDDETK